MPASIPEPAVRRSPRAAGVWGFFTSIRLALVLILIIIGLSLVSLCLVQSPSGIRVGSPEYAYWLESVIRPDFGIWADTLSLFGLFTIFHSPWFVGSGILLMLNILCCTINRWRGIKRVLSGGSIPTRPDYYRDMPLAHHTVSPAAAAAASVGDALRRRHYRVRTEESAGAFFIAGDRYRFSRLGTLVSHLSLILLVLGFLLGGLLGFRDEAFIVAEGTVGEVGYETGLSLGLVSFRADYWPDGLPRDYRSEVVVYQDGQPVTEGIIRVNHPLSYAGVRFYQSFDGPAAVMKVRTTDGAGVTDTTVALTGTMAVHPWQRPTGRLELPGTGLTAYLVAPASNAPDPVLAENQLDLEIYQGGATVPLDRLTLEKGVPQETAGLEFTYLESRSFSGFSVKYDPGVWLVWLACGLFFTGIMVVLYLPARQVRGMVAPTEDGSTVYIGLYGRRIPGPGSGLEKLRGEIAARLPGRTVYRDREEMTDV